MKIGLTYIEILWGIVEELQDAEECEKQIFWEDLQEDVQERIEALGGLNGTNKTRQIKSN